jgi:hypothetical protein
MLANISCMLLPERVFLAAATAAAAAADATVAHPQSLSPQEYVPFQPYVEGPLLVLLHIAKTLPRYITAAAAAGPGPSALAAVFGGLSAADAAAGSARIADPASLGKLKRDLFFRWVWGGCMPKGFGQLRSKVKGGL